MGAGEETWCDLIVTYFFFSRETVRSFSRLLFKVRYGKGLFNKVSPTCHVTCRRSVSAY